MIPHSFHIRLSPALTLLFLLASWGADGQQRGQHTQYMFNGLLINPAYAGADGPLNLTFIQRSQWAGVRGAPSTQTLLAHSLFKEKQMGLGLVITNDRIGVHKELNAQATYAYHLSFGRDRYLSMGVQAGVTNRKSDYLSLAGDSNADPNLFNPFISHTALNFGAGIYFRSGNLHLGLSAPQIMPQKLELNDSLALDLGKTNYLIFAKYRLPLTQAIDLEPGALVKYLPGLPLSFDLNVNVVFHRVLSSGISYRKGESIDLILKGQVTPQLQFGYAYDHPIGVIKTLSNGSHEIMVSYLFKFVRSGINSPR
jgi:type IX secretion system PorP/SprF family membrane protein